jgi:uncharacterized membrane protein
MIEIQKTPASHGLLWIKHGYRLIMRSPLKAVSLAMVFVLLLRIIIILPVEFVLLGMLVSPVIFAGYMQICRALEYSQKIEPLFIFAGFKNRTAQLILLGGMMLLGMIIVTLIFLVISWEALNVIYTTYGKQLNPGLLMEAMLKPESGMLPGMMVGFILMQGLFHAMQFATMLVFFDLETPLAAFKTSVRAIVNNIIPLSVYIFLLQLLSFAASPLPRIIGLVILLPIGLTSIYVAYRDIFSQVNNPAKAEEGG